MQSSDDRRTRAATARNAFSKLHHLGRWFVLLTLGLGLASAAPAAERGDECKLGVGVAAQYVCTGGTVCRQAINKMYCSNPGKVCGWPGTGGYTLGQKKVQSGKRYECTAAGFQVEPARLGHECKTGLNVPPEFLCEAGKVCLLGIDKSYCSNPGMVCGHQGSGGHGLGYILPFRGKTYECGPTGFLPRTPAGTTAGPPRPMTRSLLPAEIRLAQRVFGRSLNYGRVQVTNLVGPTPVPVTTPAVGGHVLNVSFQAYENLAAPPWNRLLIHELAHVWQAQNGKSFVAGPAQHNTAKAIGSGSFVAKSNRYPASRQWRDYDAEQQATIIEAWFLQGMNQRHDLYPYIRDNVLPGKPDATTNLKAGR